MLLLRLILALIILLLKMRRRIELHGVCHLQRVVRSRMHHTGLVLLLLLLLSLIMMQVVLTRIRIRTKRGCQRFYRVLITRHGRFSVGGLRMLIRDIGACGCGRGRAICENVKRLCLHGGARHFHGLLLLLRLFGRRYWHSGERGRVAVRICIRIGGRSSGSSRGRMSGRVLWGGRGRVAQMLRRL